ncbi:MAG: hypothetical protein IJK18_08820 [Clostridia bacterium]|nr:hypothetical protein [Clostridia bacterium]
MKLLKCHIQNFGKLQDFSYEFQDGLNTIKQDNGFGKTTFATFIKSMFYGLDTQANARFEKSDRKKYIPWQGGIYGGSIDFEIDSKKYRIERTFGKKATDDTFKLYNLKTNLESNDYSENIGEEIFKINKSAYERSTYIPQGQIQIEMEDSINAKLTNMLESDNDINTSEEALKKLNEAKKVYKKDRGQGGLIDEKNAKLYELQRKFENSKLDVENFDIRKKQLEAKIKEISNIEKQREGEQKLLSKKIEQDRLKAKKEVYDSIINKYQSYQEEYKDFEKFFSNGIPTNAFLENLTNKNYEIEKTKLEIANCKMTDEETESLEQLQNRFKNENISIEEIDKKIFEYSQIQEIEKEVETKKQEKDQTQKELDIVNQKRKKTLIIILLSLILTIAGISLVITNMQKVVGIAIFFLGALLGAFSLLSKNKKHKISSLSKEILNIQKEIEVLQTKKEEINNNVESFIKQYYLEHNSNKIMDLTNLKTEYSNYKALLKNKIAKDVYLQNLKINLEKLKNEIEDDFKTYFITIDKSYIDLIQDLKNKVNQFEESKNQLKEIIDKKEKYEKENNIEELKNIEEISASEEEIKHKIDVFNNHIDSLIDEKNQIKNQIEILENRIDESEYLESDIESLREEINNLEDKYKILKTTEELLKTSKENFSSSYLKSMIIGFNKYLSVIDTKELKTSVDTNLDVKIEVNGSQKEIKTFSAGYKDLIYICMRFSLIDALFNGETPFVVLDDPFVNLDEAKTSKALEILQEFTKKYQVIYFSCNASRI